MPTYQYECDSCGYAFEELQSMLDKKLKKCPKCKKLKLSRLIGGGSGIIFKGSGFYETDFKSKPSKPVQNSNTVSTTESVTSEPKKDSTPKSEAT